MKQTTLRTLHTTPHHTSFPRWVESHIRALYLLTYSLTYLLTYVLTYVNNCAKKHEPYVTVLSPHIHADSILIAMRNLMHCYNSYIRRASY